MSHEIEYVPLSKLSANPLNPKNHDEALMSKSLSKFGYIEPIVLDTRTGYMVSGHGRAKVLGNLFNEGASVPDGIQVSKDGEWLVPVIKGWASKNDTEANAALVALNRTTERGGWDEQNLLTILQELAEKNVLDVVGYVESDVKILERALEAQDVFQVDVSTAIDEFLDDTGADTDMVGFTFTTMVRVYFQTEEARADFYKAIDYPNVEKQKRIRYPKTYQREEVPTWMG